MNRLRERLFAYTNENHQNSGFSIYRHYIDAGTSFPIHWHDYYEFEILLSGRAQHIRNNTVSEIGAGNAYLMCYNDFHSMTALTDLVIYKVHFKKEFLSSDLTDYLEFHTSECCFTDEETTAIKNLLTKLEAEAASNQPFGELMIRNGIEHILVSLLRKQCSTLFSGERAERTKRGQLVYEPRASTWRVPDGDCVEYAQCHLER